MGRPRKSTIPAILQENDIPEEAHNEQQVPAIMQDIPDQDETVVVLDKKTPKKLTQQQITDLLAKRYDHRKNASYADYGLKLKFPTPNTWHLEMSFADLQWYSKAEEKAQREGYELNNTSWQEGGNMTIPLEEVERAMQKLITLRKKFSPFKDVQAKKAG